MNYHNLPHQLNRRQIIKCSGMSGIGYLLGSCSTDKLTTKISDLAEPLNQSFEELLVSSQQLIPEFFTSALAFAKRLHPQKPSLGEIDTNRMNGNSLPVENGAPLRLAAPIKLGYKQSKWVTKVTFTSQISKGGKGFWEEQGYEWFGGI